MWHSVYLILKLNICLAAGPHHLSTGLINPIKTERVQVLSIIRFLPMQVSQLYPIAMSFIKQASNRGIKPFLKFFFIYCAFLRITDPSLILSYSSTKVKIYFSSSRKCSPSLPNTCTKIIRFQSLHVVIPRVPITFE